MFWNPNVKSLHLSRSRKLIHWQLKYIKAYAYRVKPLAPKGALSVDGEIFPFEEFQVETHQGLATLLSPQGYYAADFARPSKAPT
jgi:sphingosine kinase